MMDLKTLMSQYFMIQPTAKLAANLDRLCRSYEVRGENSQALNTPLLGVTPIYFLTKDVDALFEVCGVDKNKLQQHIKNDIAVDNNFETVTNGFNILIMWVIHLFMISKLPTAQKEQGTMALLKLFHYRCFTGRVSRQFMHGANVGIMTATIDGLSAKHDIKQKETATWKLLIEQHCRRALVADNLKQGFHDFSPDKSVFTAISGMATSLSAKIITISAVYYKNHAAGISIGSVPASTLNSEGEKELRALKGTMDLKINELCGSILNVNRLINQNHVKVACAMTTAMRPDMLRELLITFSGVATEQYRNKLTEEVRIIGTGKNKKEIYVGYRKLVYELVQKTLRRCIFEGTVNMSSTVAIVDRTRDIYRSSRVNDPEIILVKDSLDYFVRTNTKYTREATLVTLRNALIVYLMISVLTQ